MKNQQRFILSGLESDIYSNSDYLFRPKVFHMKREADIVDFERFLNNNYSQLNVHNNIENQVKELYKTNNPRRKFQEKELKEFYRIWEGERDVDYYGTWVYYPWNNNLVHLLEEKDFIHLRTSRNNYKITPAEQKLLSTKKVGVIGLSVGQSVALTMAMERVFGTLRIADFDHLDLSNLNRIRSSVANIGLPKTIMVAREIAEIDPFLEIELFNEGITEDNLNDFLGSGASQLDLLVEECDSLDIKIKSRLAARAKRIPVIMDTSDRGMMDIERFDLNADAPIMHGMVDESRAEEIDQWTAKERLALVMDMVGADNISSRLKASLLEVEESLTTWPQLASSVVLGGAISTVVVRKVLLGEDVESGRYYLDADEHFSKNSHSRPISQSAKPQELSFTACEVLLAELSLEAPGNSVDVHEDLLEDMVQAACLAPSGGNVQPWKWIYKDGLLALFHDVHQSHSFLDFRHRGSYIGLGAASENLRQRAAHHNLQIHQIFGSSEFGEALVAVFAFSELKQPKLPLGSFGADLNVRLTNRKKTKAFQAIPSVFKKEVEKALTDSDFKIKSIEQKEQVEALAQIIGKIERQRILDPWGHQDFINEARWTKEEAESTKNGVDLRTLDLNEADKVGFKLISDAQAIESLRKWDRGQALVKMSADAVENTSLCLIYSDKHGAKTMFEAGEWVERIWLYFNVNGMAYQPVSPATFMFARLAVEDKSTSLYLRQNLAELRNEYLELLNLPENVNDIFLSRLFFADEPEVKSLRKPLNEVYKNLNTN